VLGGELRATPINGNTVRSFSTHGQQSAAKASSTTVPRCDIRLIQYLFGLLGSWFGPEVEHGAHFLILYYPPPPRLTTVRSPRKPYCLSTLASV
jgi:hypothetical protein